jgi:thioredoxin 1
MSQCNEHLAAQLEREIRGATRPLLVNFCTSWSVPSRITESVLSEVAKELADDLGLRTVNLDAHPDLAKRYGITEVPTLVLFNDGAPLASFSGATTPLELKARLQGLLADYAPQRPSQKRSKKTEMAHRLWQSRKRFSNLVTETTRK